MEDSAHQHQLKLPHPENHQYYFETSSSRQTGNFNERIIRIVRSNLAKMLSYEREASYDIGLEGLPQITDPSQPVPLRCAWILVIIVCLAACLFQVYSCGATYYSQPVAVDVKIREQEELVFPSITLVNTESNGLYSTFHHFSPNMSITVGIKSCINPVRELIDIAEGMNVSDIWLRLNSSESFVTLKVASQKQEFPLSVIEEFGLFGLQTRQQVDKPLSYGGINTKFVCEIRKIIDGCDKNQIMGAFQAHGMATDLRTFWSFTSLLALDVTFSMQKFEFVSRRTEPCVDYETYYSCRAQCAVVAFNKFPCRFPFLPKEVTLPTCIAGSKEAGDLYLQTMIAFAKMPCACPRMCEETTFSVSVSFAGELANLTRVSAYFGSNLMTLTKERFAYDFISLLSDIGGSLGLCLGFSLLSIVQFLQGLFKIANCKKSNTQERSRSSLFRNDKVTYNVYRILQDELQRFRLNKTNTYNFPISGLSTVMNAGAKPILRVSWLLVIAICFISYCVFTYIRIKLYISVPTQIKVEITKNSNVQFPTLSICGNNHTAIKVFKKLAKKKKKFRQFPSGGKMFDWCSFQLTDLLDLPGVTAQMAWEVSSVVGEFDRAQNVGEFLGKYQFVKNVVHNPVYLPDGKCSQFLIGEQEYAGTNTLFSKLTFSKVDQSFHREALECDRSYSTVYVTPPGAPLQLNSRLIYPKVAKTILILESKKVTVLNLRRKPCIEPQTANECHKRCFEKLLLDRIKCRLPYMPLFSNLTNCLNSTIGKEAHNVYMELSLTLDPFHHKTCGCIQSCTKILFSTIVYVEPMDLLQMTLIGSIFFTNIQHHTFEETVDSLSKLLCDLGGNLGLALGLSLLSIFDMIQSLLFLKFKGK